METRILMGDTKAKAGIAFLYDPPPGMDRQLEKANNLLREKNINPEDLDKKGIHKKLLGQGPNGTNKFSKNAPAMYKFDWQRHAPRQAYLNDASNVEYGVTALQIGIVLTMV